MNLKTSSRGLLFAAVCAPLWMGAEECTTGNIGDQKVCEYGGKVYAPGDQFPSEDRCNTCTCTEDGSAACTEKACGPGAGTCEYDGQVYAVGERFKDTDGCNTCTCEENGDAACTLLACAPDDGGNSGSDPGGNVCEHEGKYYASGTSFVIGCAGCGCGADGNVTCDAIACMDQCSFGEQSFAQGTDVICPDGCNSCTCTAGGWIQTEKGCSELPKVEKCDGPATSEVVKVRPLYSSEDALALEFSYGGGCKEHSFRLCTDGALTKSLPGQLKLWLVDDGEPDTCEAFLTEAKVFDLSSLKGILGAQANGNIVLRIGNSPDESSIPYAF